MATGMTTYGDLSPREAGYIVKELLERGFPHLTLEKFGKTQPLPKGETKTAKFRRYYMDSPAFTDVGSAYNPFQYFATGNFDPTAKELAEGVTPNASKLAFEDINVTVKQYGDRLQVSDVIMDTHTDPVLQEAVDILGEQAALLAETVRVNVLKAGLNVFYANGATRNAVNTAISLNLIRKAVRKLKRNNGVKITKTVKSTPNYGTESVNAAYVCVIHPDVEPDIRGLSGFVPVEKYGMGSPWESEIGKVEDVRFVTSTVITPFADAGGAVGSMLSTSGTAADVYPCFLIAKDAYGIIPLKGGDSMVPMVVNPKPSDSDPMGQRGHVSVKFWQAAVILNEAWVTRLEVSASAL